MHTAKTGAGQGATPGLGPREVWVHETGLPHIGPHPLVDHLGRRMLLATDLSSASRGVEARAIEVAQAAGAHLLVLAIIPSEASPDTAHQKRLRALVRRARRRGIHAQGEITSGDPADSILRVATASRADAIIIGDDQWRGWKNAGCVCGHVILHSPCAVLITHAPTAA
jgi:nucleotide-binding universal stress UspA family protein